MLLLGLLGCGLIMLASIELSMATNYRDGIAALYLAEAGAKRALVELHYNPGWQPSNPYYEGSGSYALKITDGLPVTIEATGTVHRSVRKVVLKVTIISEAGSPVSSITINSWNYH
jgi:hypothetical protein